MWAVSLLVIFLLGEGGKDLALEISDSPNYSCWPARGEPWLREPSHFSKTWPKLKLGYLGVTKGRACQAWEWCEPRPRQRDDSGVSREK